MSLLTVVKDVCMAVGVEPPVSMFGTAVQPRTQAELLALANEMAQRIAYDVREWTVMKEIATFNGNGVLDRFPLPDNFLRMLLTTNLYGSWMPRIPLRYISDTDEWINRRLSGAATTYNEWTRLGTDILIYPILSVGQTVSFGYLQKNCIALNAGGYGDMFVNDLDTFRMPERLLKLGMIWQWKASKGSPYAEDMGTYSDALTMLAGADKPSPILVDRLPISAAAQVALPWPSSWGVTPP